MVRQVAFYGTWSSVADRGMKLENGNLGAWKVSAVHSECLDELSAKIPEPYGWPTVCTRGTGSSCLAKSGNTSNFRALRCSVNSSRARLWWIADLWSLPSEHEAGSSLDFRRRRSLRMNDFGGVSGELNCGTRVSSLVCVREREREKEESIAVEIQRAEHHNQPIAFGSFYPLGHHSDQTIIVGFSQHG